MTTPKPAKASKTQDQLRELTIGLAPESATSPSPAPRKRAQTAAPRRRARSSAPMPAERSAEPAWGGPGAQINLTVDRDMKRWLGQMQLDDGIETTARLRAAISLMQDDPRLLARVNKRAADFKGRNRK